MAKWRWNGKSRGLQVWREYGWFFIAYYEGQQWRFWDPDGAVAHCFWGTDPAPTRAFVEGLERPPHD